MAKAPKFGVSYYKGTTPRKRPGRHKKNLNKHEKLSFKKYNRQGR